MSEHGKLHRCLRLWEALLRRREMATRDAAAELGVDAQTAMRDLKSLIDAGVPLVPVGKGADHRYRLEDEYRRALVNVTTYEALALSFGRQFMGFLGGTELAGWLDGLTEKLLPALGPEPSVHQRDWSRSFYYLSEPYRRYDAHDETLNEILSALLQHRELRVEHDPENPKVYERLQPLTLVVYRRALYLLADEPGSPRHRCLAVDRMVTARRLPARFEPPADYDPRPYLERAFGIYATGEPEEVVLRFLPWVARLVRARQWHPTQSLHDLPDGRVELRMTTCGRELVRLALEFGETVEVVAPDSLRHAVIAELKGALAHYGLEAREGEAVAPRPTVPEDRRPEGGE